MAALSLTDITNAINNSSVCIRVDELKGSKPEKYNGRTICFSGNYGAVFKFVLPSGKRKAVRVWTKDLDLLPELPSRSKIISDQLGKLKSKYFSDFNFYDKGILVNGRLYPLVVMDWEEGANLKDYISTHLTDSDKLIKLSKSFVDILQWLHSKHISHGDLQHGNILVDENAEIKLIDYDSIYLPNVGFDNAIESIKGLPDYQHPSRMDNLNMTEKADYFSELVIYASLKALAVKPDLWSKYNVEDRDYSLLFDANDYKDFDHSLIYSDLKSLGNEFVPLLKVFDVYLSKNNIKDLDPFEVLMTKMSKLPVIKQISYSPKKNLYAGDTVKLKWDISDATRVSVNSQIQTENQCELTLKEGCNDFVLTASTDFKTVDKTISIDAFEKPSINIYSGKRKLHAGKSEKCVIEWVVTKAQKVFLECDAWSKEVDASGEESVMPETTTIYKIRAIGKDKKRSFEEKLEVSVFPEAEVEFSVDRRFTLPDVPIVLTWRTKDAKKVELKGNGEVPMSGQLELNVKKQTVFELFVTDEFGTKTKTVEVKMLPLPTIKTINVSVPDINKPIKVSISIPKFKAKLSCPTFHLPNVDAELPEAKSLDKVWEYIKDSKCSSILMGMKSLFYYFFKKTNKI